MVVVILTENEKIDYCLRNMSAQKLSEMLKDFSLDDIYEAVVNTEGQGNPEEVKPFLITVDKKVDGVKVPTIANVASNYLDIMRYDRYFSIVKYNTLSGLPEKHKVKGKSQWTDADDASARTYIEANYSIFNRQKYEDAFAEFQHEREYCPIKDKIDSLIWDGQKRVENFLFKWLGADDTPYNRECSRLLFAGSINRAYRAGCKFDDVIVLIGKQGGGKSTICQWLALDMELYSSIKTINGQKGLEGISGKWIVEIEELLATLANDYSGTKSEENCKAFLSTASDFYRKPYDRRPTDSPRRCIFIGTTNRTEFLTDKTGNRRWYPVTVKSDARFLYDNEKECKEYISQCWAEMKSAFDKGDDFAKPVENVSLLSDIKSKQSEAEQDDWREGVIEEYLDGKIRTCLIEIWQRALYKDRSPHFPEMKRKDSNELIGIVVNKLGWTRGNAENFNGFGKQKSFYNPKAEEEIKKLDAELPK